MIRIIKEADKRRNETLDATETLITEKGYSKTTIIDILNQTGIAKGTFYYYFRSKKGVMNTIIKRFIGQSVQRTRLMAMDKSISSVRKMCRIIAVKQPRTDGPKDRVVKESHLPANALIREGSTMHLTLTLSPISDGIAPREVKERLFSTKHPLGTMQILLVSGQILFDSSMFTWTPCKMKQKIDGFIEATETVLGAEKGTLEPVKQILAVGSGCTLQKSESWGDEW